MKNAAQEFKPPFDTDEHIDPIFESKINDDNKNLSSSDISDTNGLLEDLVEDILKSILFFILND